MDKYDEEIQLYIERLVEEKLKEADEKEKQAEERLKQAKEELKQAQERLKQAKEELKQAEERLRQIQERSNTMLFLIRDVCSVIREKKGLSNQEIIDRLNFTDDADIQFARSLLEDTDNES